MGRRLLVFYLLVLVLIGIFVSISVQGWVYSQTETPPQSQMTNFEDVYRQYHQRIEEYEDLHDEYLLARSQYLNFKTPTSQEKAISTTKNMLQKRDEVVVWYLMSLKQRLKEAKGVDTQTVERLSPNIDQEISWFLSHKEEINSSLTLEDLVGDSQEAYQVFLNIDPLIYEVLIFISRGKVINFSGRTKEIFDEVKSKLEEIRIDTREGYSFSQEKFQRLDKWMLDSQNQIAKSQERLNEVDGIILSLSKAKKSRVELYNQAILILGQAQLHLKNANFYLTEVLREIKTAEN